MNTTVSFLNEPVVVAFISVGATALVTLAFAAIKTVITLAQLKSDVAAIHTTLTEMKADPDVMRWSNYGRAAQAFQNVPHMPGGNP